MTIKNNSLSDWFCSKLKCSFHVVGFLQLAGGTNARTVDGLKREGLFQVATASGINF